MEASEKLIFFKLIIYFTCFLVLISLGFYFLFITYKKRIEREQEALRNAEINFERQINEASLKAEEKERVQIAMDLHDEIGTLMTVLKINMINAKKRMDQPERLHKVLNETSDMIEKTADAVRNISNRISPPTLTKLGLEVTLIDLVSTVNSTGKMIVIYSSNLEDKRFRVEAELNIYRIIKEMVNNILKHSHTDKLFLQIQLNDNFLKIDFKYLGVGLSDAQVAHLLRVSKGNGLKSIQSRINNLRATIAYELHKDEQAEVHIKIPVNEIKN